MVNKVNLICNYQDANGNPIQQGKVSFTPNAQVLDTSTDHLILTQTPVVVDLSSSPAPTVPLIATDNAGMAPSGWSYLVSPQFPGAPPAQLFSLPYTGGATQNLSDLLPVVTSPVVPTGGTYTGTVILDGTPALQIPAGAGSGKVLGSDPSGNVSWVLDPAGAAAILAPTSVKTGAYTAAASEFVRCDTTSAGFTVTLLAAPANGTVVAVKLIASAATVNAVTIARGGSDVFNAAGGPTSLTLPLLRQGVVLQYISSGGIWLVYSDDLPLGALDARYPPATATQGGTAGSPALTQQWQFQAANTTNTAGAGAFGSVFWPGTFGSPSVTETSWDFGYNSPKLAGYSSTKPQAYFSVLPDCGDTHGVEIETVWADGAGHSCFPFQFVGTTDGTATGNWLLSLPQGDGTFQLGVHTAGGTIDNYLSMSGLEAASAGSPGSATFGMTAHPVTLTVTGALQLSQRLAMIGTTALGNSLNLTLGGASAPSGVNAQIYLECAAGASNIIGLGYAGTDAWHLQTLGGSANLTVFDSANNRTAMTWTPGTTSTSLVTFNGPVRFFFAAGFYNTTAPASQPTAAAVTAGYTAGSSTAVTTDGTFTGGTGATAYTIADVVKALKAVGLIAA